MEEDYDDVLMQDMNDSFLNDEHPLYDELNSETRQMNDEQYTTNSKLATQAGEMVIYTTDDGGVNVQVDMENETLWLTQKAMAQVFGVGVPAISKHLNNIFAEGELDSVSVISKMETTAADGKNYLMTFYNLDAIIAVGYRVNSARATQFRIWATKTLRTFLTRGYVLDKERFKQGRSLRHFQELLEEIREIRLSERLFYQQIKDIYRLSEDYDPKADITKDFFAEVQNKLLWAVSKNTAAELRYYRANAELPLMGLTSTAKAGKVRKSDTEIGKNYLSSEELQSLKLIVSQYLDFAEARATEHTPMFMKDWREALNAILTLNRKELLEGSGKISKALADKKVEAEYTKYRERERTAERLESIKELDRDLRQFIDGK